MRSVATRLSSVLTAFFGLCLACLPAAPAAAQTDRLSQRDSFPLGSGSQLLCQVQAQGIGPALQSPFDRAWTIVCRDSALPVGTVYALRGSEAEVAARLADLRASKVDCTGGAMAASALVDGAAQMGCSYRDPVLAWTVISKSGGKAVFVAEGFAAYQSALALAMRSLMADRIVAGDLDIATISVADNAAFSRLQALTLDPKAALGEGYRRNNAGDYADAGEFFETLQQRIDSMDSASSSTTGPARIEPAEFLINRALQKSNLGEFAEADRLFAEARALPSTSPVVERLRRNFEGVHLINQGRYDAAIARLNQPVKALVDSAGALRTSLVISQPIADRINAGDRSSALLGFVDDLSLTEDERATIIDAQKRHLIATAQRLSGNPGAARASLAQALDEAVAVRDGRVVSIIRLRAQIISELALIAENEGQMGEAETLLQSAIDLVSVQYPETRALAAAKARLAAFLVRRGEDDRAMALYRDVVIASRDRSGAVTGLSNQIAPYFSLLAARMPGNPALAADFMDATQILSRPGVAETQAILSRELSAGADEASRLFRQATSLNRSIERERIRFVALSKVADSPMSLADRASSAAEIARLETAQQALLVDLNRYPQYRAISSRALPLADLQSSLKPGEAYARLAVVGGKTFMLFVTRDTATGYEADIGSDGLEKKVDALRSTISRFDGTRYVTEPFDVETARELYVALFAPVSGQLGGVKHLIFEPDGAMLRLPVNLLIADGASADAYLKTLDSPDGDPFDVSGIGWLGRNIEVSTAVSARSFHDSRAESASRASRPYLGLGQNAVVSGNAMQSLVRAPMPGDSADCQWPLTEWNKPISDKELRLASSIVGGGQSDVITGSAFADDRLLARDDLDNYRILHFATHGLVSAPRPQCPARPALLTSFGGAGSDGLLTFREIFDLKLDADVVILSACDTAGRADVAATREAGLTSGGGAALDGLVRAFVGAGGRTVLASHWPAPDDYDATGRLIGGMFRAAPGTPLGATMLAAQQALMADPVTSHPYYWAGFAIIGDSQRPLLLGAGDRVAMADHQGE